MKITKPLNFNNFDFSRASEATYYNSSGTLVVAGVDVIREGYDPYTNDFMGTILENAATNIVPYANDFSEWTKNTSATELGAEAPPNNPDSSNPTTFMDLSGSGEVWGIRQDVGNINGVYTFSAYAKIKSPGAGGVSSVVLQVRGGVDFIVFVRFNINATAPSILFSAGASSSSVQRISNGWVRISATFSAPVDANNKTVYILGDDAANSGVAGNGLHYIWGAQVEAGPSPTSFIYTEGSPATRAADITTSGGEGGAAVISTNVAENEAPEWDSSTEYQPNDDVQVLSIYHEVYRANVVNTDKFPPNNTPETWTYRGNTNPWRMFDMNTGPEFRTVATDPDNSIDVELAVPAGVNSVTLINIYGESVLIVVRDQNGEEVARYFENLMGAPLQTGWWDFWFGIRESTDLVTFNDFELPMGGTITVTVEGGDDPAEVGKLVVGSAVEIGCARFGTSAGIIDFSRKERDPFGGNVVVERRYIDKCDYDILVDTDDTYFVKQFLASIRATPAVYIGSEKYQITIVFGFFRDFSIILPGPVKSSCALQVEGI